MELKPVGQSNHDVSLSTDSARERPSSHLAMRLKWQTIVEWQTQRRSGGAKSLWERKLGFCGKLSTPRERIPFVKKRVLPTAPQSVSSTNRRRR